MTSLLGIGLGVIIMIEVGIFGALLEVSNMQTRKRIAELDEKIEKIVKEGEE